MKFRLYFFCFILFLLSVNTHLRAQSSWQYVKKIGTNKSYASNTGDVYPIFVLGSMFDSKQNQYLLLNITGDTFYYNDYIYKRTIHSGCSGATLLKLSCDGSVAWSKIISNKDKTYANYLGDGLVNLCFGKDENEILISLQTIYKAKYHIDIDTIVNGPSIGGIAYRYTIFYDSLGGYKKTVYRHPDSGQSQVHGYIPASNRYYLFRTVDSANEKINYKGKNLRSGDYLFLLDSNFNYYKITSINQRVSSATQFLSDTTQPANFFNGQTQWKQPKFSSFIKNNKIFCYESLSYSDNTTTTNKIFVVNQDTLRRPNNLKRFNVNIFFAYNDTGGHVFTKFTYPLKANSVGSAGGLIQSEDFRMGVDNKFYFIKKDIDTVFWGADTIMSKLPQGTRFITYGCIDTNGKLLWTNDLEYFNPWTGTFLEYKMDLTPNNEIVMAHNMQRYNFPGHTSFKFKLGGQWYNNDTTLPTFDNNNKLILMKLKQHSQELIDIGQNGTRMIWLEYVSVNGLGDIHVFGEKRANGFLLNNDSSNILYQNLGVDYFMAKYGSATCNCDTVTSSFLPTDTTQFSKITVQYNGTATDSVLYIWGDGTQTYVKPATAPFTKTYTGGSTFLIQCIAKNNCSQPSVSQFLYKIKCDTVTSSFTILDSTQPGKIQVVYNGMPTDSVLYLWGDGTQSLVKPTSTVQIKVYNKDTILTIRAVVYNKCKQGDTFSRSVHIKCGTLVNQFTILTTATKTAQVQYTGSTIDTVTYLWGDGLKSIATAPSTQVTSHIYTTSLDSVKISTVIKNKCGKADTVSKWYVFCKSKLNVQAKSFCDTNLKITVSTDTNYVFQNWSDATTSNSKTITTTQKITGIYLQKNGCSYRDSFDIKKWTSPTVQKSTKYLNCIKTPISLTVFNAEATAYLWSNNLSLSVINVNTKGTYSVKITHPCGIFNDTFKVFDTASAIFDTTKKISCTSYLWRDTTYTKTGKYTRKIMNASSCDSFVTLDLTIGIDAKIKLTNGINYSTQDTYKTYQWYLCTPWKKITNQTTRYFTTTTRGSYAVVVSNGFCTDTSDCVALYSAGLQSVITAKAVIYPNPARDKLNIDFNQFYKETKLRIYDMQGKLIVSSDYLSTDKIQIDVEKFPAGIYSLHIAQDKEITNYKFLKE
jgi:hypothetical protein